MASRKTQKTPAKLDPVAQAKQDNKRRTNSLEFGKKTPSAVLNRLRLGTFVAAVAEILLIGLAVLFYFYDIPKGFTSFMTLWRWVAALSAIVIIDILGIWFVEARFAKMKRASDLEAASVLGNDIQEAYKFGKLGLAITDDNGCVIWTSSFFRDHFIDLLDVNIFEWEPRFNNFLDENLPSDFKIEFDCGNFYFSVRYLADAHLFMFRDITDYHTVMVTSENQQLVIGYLMIDNYDEKFERSDEAGNDDVLTKVRAAIMAYCKKNEICLRRYRGDSYMLVGIYSSLEKMMDDQFSILKDVRDAAESKSGFVPTLSIGIAYGENTLVTRLSEIATNALNVAMSRGGDQAVVSKVGDELLFFGGKTPSVENTNRVQFRSLADSLISIIKSSSFVVVSGHKNMDMDAFGACLGIWSICHSVGRPCRIAYDMKQTELKTRGAISSELGKGYEDLFISPSEAVDRMKPKTLLIVVDVSVPTNVIAEHALEKSTKTVVIDHHRPGDKTIEHPILNHTDSSASSTCEIIAEMIHYTSSPDPITLSPLFATFMLSGMFLDTNFFKSSATGARTFEAAEILKGFGADNVKADSFLKDDLTEYQTISQAFSEAESVYPGVLVACLNDDDDPLEDATISKIAVQCMMAKGVHASFAIARISSKAVKISARSDGTINVQLLAEKLGGGGHFEASAAVFLNTAPSIVKSKVIDVLKNYLDLATSDNANKGGAA